MKPYLVTWVIEIDAEDPTDAANKALEIQRDTQSLATDFLVKDIETKKVSHVDVYFDGLKENDKD